MPEGATVLKLLADLGIPAEKVDLVLAGGVSVDLRHPIREGERISIYPVFEALDISEVTRIRGEPLRDTRFVADRSLEPLALRLRNLGFDAEIFDEAAVDPYVLRRAEAERRILLTMENQHPGATGMSRVLFLDRADPRAQLRTVLFRLDLFRSAARHSWQVTPGEAEEIQERLRCEVVTSDEIGEVRLIGGVDVAFEKDDTRARAAVAVLSFPELDLLESATASVAIRFPYIPGLLSFRETPAVLEALAGLRRLPDLLFCDGHGLAHPRRFGMACHVGVLTGIPTVGVAKTLLIGSYANLPPEAGAWVPLVDGGETLGAVVRTRAGVKPVYVSVGCGISLETAIRLVLSCSRYRLPEPSRRADHLSRMKNDG